MRSHWLLSRARLCRSAQRQATPGRSQQIRSESWSSKNGGGGQAYSRAGLLGTVSGAGAVSCLCMLCLAKWSPKARSWLESTVPGSKTFFGFVLKDRHAKATETGVASAAPRAAATPSIGVSSAQDAAASPERAVEEPTAQAKADPVTEAEEEQLRLAVLEELRRSSEATKLEEEHEAQRKEIEEEAQRLLEETVREAEARAKSLEEERLLVHQLQADEERAAAVAVSRDLDTALQHVLGEASDSSTAMYSLIGALRQHSLAVYKMIELQAAHSEVGTAEADRELAQSLDALQQAQAEADACSARVDEAVAEFDSMCAVARKGGESDSAAALVNVAGQALQLLHAAAEEVATCRADQVVMDLFLERMTQQCELYKREMERLSDVLQSSSTEPRPSDPPSAAQSVFDADIQSLLSFAQQRVECMQESLASGRGEDAKEVSALLLQQRAEDMRVAQLKLDHLREQLVREHQEELQKQEVQLKLDTESEISRQLQHQTAAHADHLRTALERQANDVGRKYRALIQAALKDQIEEYQHGYHRLAGTMEGIQSTADSAVGTVQEGFMKLDLCKACSLLLTAVTSEQTQRQPLMPVVGQLRAAAAGDAIIEAALDSIPEPALSRGIQSPTALQRRFANVKTACSRVAFVGDKEESGVLTYFVSHLSSLLHWQKPLPDSASVVDTQSLDVPGLLDLAERRINQGNVEDAVRLVNQLTGQPRVLAQDWLDEARLFLTTQQAADVVSSCALLHLSAKVEAEVPLLYLIEE